MRRPELLLPMLLATALVPACTACEDDPSGRVPFRQGADEPPDRPAPEDEDAPFEPAVARTFPEGTARVAVEGAPLTAAGGSVRALLPLDVDGDGDRDALLVRAADDGSATLAFARREGDGFRKVESVGDLAPAGEDCRTTDPSLRTVSRRYAVVSLQRICPDAAVRTLGILSIGDSPHLLERISLLPEEGRTPGEVRLGLRTADISGDDHEDVILEVAVRPPGAKEAGRVSLPWLDRPAGLARDKSEPDASLSEIADRAREALAEDPDAAASLAQRALALHGVLCRESDGARLRFGDTDGLTCGPSAGAGRAAAVEAAALARRGDFFAALQAEQRLTQPGYRVTETERGLVERAWARAPVPDGIRWRKVASHRPGAMPDVHLPAVSFSDAETLLLRGGSPQVVDLETGESKPAPEAAGPGLVRDPTGELAVVDVHRTCEGYALSIVRAEDVVAGVVAGRPVAEPLLEPKAPPAGARCPDLDGSSVREDTGGWHVLGWAPQGVVAVRGAAVRIVPLTVDGQRAGEASELEPGTPPPAPLPRGQATPDGRTYVLGSAHGVLLRHTGPDGQTHLLRPEGWSGNAEPPEDVAIAPDASRVAVLRGGDVWVIEGLP
ncbi:MAG: hypothetical protein ACOC97_02875 [Myxococcota bacterium]